MYLGFFFFRRKGFTTPILPFPLICLSFCSQFSFPFFWFQNVCSPLNDESTLFTNDIPWFDQVLNFLASLRERKAPPAGTLFFSTFLSRYADFFFLSHGSSPVSVPIRLSSKVSRSSIKSCDACVYPLLPLLFSILSQLCLDAIFFFSFKKVPFPLAFLFNSGFFFPLLAEWFLSSQQHLS